MFAIFLPFVALSEEDGIVRKETRLYYAVSRSSKKSPKLYQCLYYFLPYLVVVLMKIQKTLKRGCNTLLARRLLHFFMHGKLW